MKLVPHSKGTIAKISALVTIFVVEHLIVTKKGKYWSIQIICQFSMSPKICLFHFQILPDGKETSAKISVLVTIFVIEPLIVPEKVKAASFKLSSNLTESPQIDRFFKTAPF